MMWGRPIKTHPHMGGATLPLKIFVRSMGLICFSAFGCLFAYLMRTGGPPPDQDKHIYMPFVRAGCPSVCQCFVFYNVRAYVYVCPNVNSS